MAQCEFHHCQVQLGGASHCEVQLRNEAGLNRGAFRLRTPSPRTRKAPLPPKLARCSSRLPYAGAGNLRDLIETELQGRPESNTSWCAPRTIGAGESGDDADLGLPESFIDL